MPNEREERRSNDRGRWARREDDRRDADEARFLRHREDDLRSVGSPGIGGGTGGYRDRERDEGPWSPPQSGLERTARGWAGWIGESSGDGGHAGKGPSGYTRPDTRIAEDANDALTDDDQVDATHIDVKVDGGEVTLNGVVPSRDMKRRAEMVVDRVRGVKDVHNHLRINGNGGVKRGPGAA